MLKIIKWLICMAIVFNVITLRAYAVNEEPRLTLMELQQQQILSKSIYNLNSYITIEEALEIYHTIREHRFSSKKDKSPTLMNYKVLRNNLSDVINRSGIYYSTNYQVKDTLTRAQTAVLISKSLNLEKVKTSSIEYDDLSANDYAYSEIMALLQLEISGFSAEGKFQPNEPITLNEFLQAAESSLRIQIGMQQNQYAYDYLNKRYIETKNMYPKFEEEIIHLINKYRIKNGLKPFKKDGYLTQIAIIKTKDMIENEYFNHYSPIYNMPWDLAGLFNYEFTSIGENLARNYSSSLDVVNAWIMSPKHEVNILNENFENIGVGIRKDKSGNYYLCNLFSGL